MAKTIRWMICCIIAEALMIWSVSASTAAEDKAVRIAYAQWSCATAASNVVKAVLQEKLGYDCRLVPMGAESMWLSTASGDVDGFVCAWLPSLHQCFYGKVEDNVVDLGPNLVGTKVGLVVPDYVPVDSIAWLDAHAEQFKGQIIGVDPGAGIMRLTEEAINAYQMAEMELISGSGVFMTNVLEEKIKNQEWVVVTGWTPHWKFARWDLKYLEDPKGVYNGSEAIHTMVRKGLKEESPRLYRFLDNFYWEPEAIHQVMDMIQRSGRPYQSAVQWVHQHPDSVEAWLAE